MSPLVPQKTELGWVIEVPAEIARELGAAEGSFALLRTRDGHLEVEIIPPPTPELVKSVQETHDEFKDAFDEMKRLGD